MSCITRMMAPKGGPSMVILGFDLAAAFVPDVSLFETVVRGVLTYLSIFALLRLILRGRTSAVSTTYLLVIVLIAAPAQHAMASESHSITNGLVLVATIITTTIVLDWLAFRSPTIRQFVHPARKALVVDGRVQRPLLRDELMTEEELMT